MRIAVWLFKAPETVGGGFSQQQQFAHIIDDHVFPKSQDVVFVTDKPVKTYSFKRRLLIIKYPVTNYLEKLFRLCANFLPKKPINIACVFQVAARLLKVYHDHIAENFLKKNKIDVVYYTFQCFCALPEFPFIATSWDIGHRSAHAFPEFHEKDNLIMRDQWFSDILPKALCVVTESQAGKSEILEYTNLGSHKLKVVPLVPGGCIKVNPEPSVLALYGLVSGKFFFYPAQFWAHKNHVGLVDAFAVFVERHPDVKLIMPGSDQGVFEHVKQRVKDFGLTDNVLFPGFVEVQVVATLYAHAIALIMPTYLGPTNMPLLEAREFGCPVLCSDFPGHRELLGEGAIYFNPMDTDQILEAMHAILHADVAAALLEKAAIERNNSCFTAKKAMSALERVFDEAVAIKKCWS